MAAVPGSETLTAILHVVSQSLLLPVVVGVLIFMGYAIISLGGLISEHSSRIRVRVDEIKNAIFSMSNPGNPERIKEVIGSMKIPTNHKRILLEIVNTPHLTPKAREAFARKLIEAEELKVVKILEKTDTITRLGPALGLMGTLIPLGPGLAALGAGDIQTLAHSLIVAFDATVVGLAAGSISYVISKVRRRWYEEHLSNLEALAETILEVMKGAAPTTTKTI